MQLSTYKKLCTEFYELEQHRDHDAAFALFMSYAAQANGPILEPMCGTGRFLIPMLHAGYDIEGFDASPDMLAALRHKWAQHTNTPVPVWHAFAQHFISAKKYNLIFIPYGSLGLITNLDDVQHTLNALVTHLAPNGKLVLEIETVASLPQPCGVWRRGVHTRADGSLLAINTLTSYEPTTQLFHAFCRYESIINGHICDVETEDFYMHLYRFDELEGMLSAAGFSEIKKYQDHQKTLACYPHAPNLLYECTR